MLKLVIEGATAAELQASLAEAIAVFAGETVTAPEATGAVEPGKKRGRPAKTDTPAVEDKKPEEKAPEPEQPKAPALTEADCRKAAQVALEAGKGIPGHEDVVRGLFGKFGANRVSELKPEIYADFIAACGVEAEKAKSSAALMD